MADFIDIKKLELKELAGVVSLYPWYGAARKELCRRMSRMGGDAWGKEEYAKAALYVVDRKSIEEIYNLNSGADCSDKDVETILRSYIHEEETAPIQQQKKEERQQRVAGGDYFTQAQYENVVHKEDNVFSRFAFKARAEAPERTADIDVSEDFCTETLAQIYAEQGYYEQAKRIYSKLLLNFPEKNAYFAALIDKIEQLEIK